MCSVLSFLQLESSDDFVASVSIDFPRKLKGNTLLHCTALNYSRDDWDSPRDYLRNVLCSFIKFSAFDAVTEFCE